MNILIIKTGALGDVLRTSFIASALKDKYKNSYPKVFWLTDKKAAPFFINNKYVDHLLISEDRDSVKNIWFDLVINLEESLVDCKFASSLKSKKIIGFIYESGKVVPSPSAKEWYDMSALGKKPENDILKKKNQKTHRQILSEIIGIANFQKYEPFLRLTEKQRLIAKNFLRRFNLSTEDLIIGINAGSADRWPKQLSVAKTVELIDSLYKKYNAKILLFGGPNEKERNKEILKLSRSPVIYTGSGNNLFEFPALISLCSLFITTDSLGLHVSLALKRKTIALIGPTSSAEIDMYCLGNKVIADSDCLCCYKKDCKSMAKIILSDIFKSVDELINQSMSVLVTAYKEPNINKCIEGLIHQVTHYKYDIYVSAPDIETINAVKSYMLDNDNLFLIKDPGKGKSFALNQAFKKIDSDIIILTDGDVDISNNSIENIGNMFLNSEIGCISGRPVPKEKRNNKYGYWAHFLYDSAHKIRKYLYENNRFLECSGYLFAFRKKFIDKIPTNVAEDSIIPYIFWEKGFKIGYCEDSLVYAKNPDNIKDWIKQKTRTNKSHDALSRYADTKITPRVKTFKNESKGIFWLAFYPKNFQEFIWSIELVFFRLFTWIKSYFDKILFKKFYSDAWDRVESTKKQDS